MRIVFAGTPAFASIILTELLQAGQHVVAVYTQPDRPAGRGLKLTPSPVKQLAVMHQLLVMQPQGLHLPEEQARLDVLQPDVVIVAAYGLLLPRAVLTIPRYGCINVHPSLLPRWRGAAPIIHTILAGDELSGVSIMQLDQGLDTGPILLQRSYLLAQQETAKTLHDKLAALGAAALLEALSLLLSGRFKLRQQDEQQAIYANKIHKMEACLQWVKRSIELERMVRAFNPWPVAYTYWQGKPLRIFSAQILSQAQLPPAQPGTILAASRIGVDVATGDGVLRLLTLQLPNGRRLSAADFYNAQHTKLVIGGMLSSQPD